MTHTREQEIRAMLRHLQRDRWPWENHGDHIAMLAQIIEELRNELLFAGILTTTATRATTNSRSVCAEALQHLRAIVNQPADTPSAHRAEVLRAAEQFLAALDNGDWFK